MNTTALGLISGIPLLIVYVVLTSKASEIVDSLEMASVKTLSIITKMAKRQNVAAAA
jgi:biopolymer transport protein ExbB